MSLIRIYLRVLGLLGPEKWLAIGLAVANVSLAGVFLLEPWLFGRVVDALAAQISSQAWTYIAWWTGVGFFGVAANALVALYSDRLAHRRQLEAIADFFEHALALPLAFHDQQHTGRLLRTLHTGSGNLFLPVAGVLPQPPEHPDRRHRHDPARAAHQLAARTRHDRADDHLRAVQHDRGAAHRHTRSAGWSS